MKETERLHDLYKQMQEERDKVKELDFKHENGKLSESSYQSQLKGITNTIDTLGKEIDEEIEIRGLSSEEYAKAQKEWQQEEEHSR